MEILGFEIHELPFGPGAVADAQAKRLSTVVVRELEDNHRMYHDRLAQQLEEAGRPEVREIRSYAEGVEAWPAYAAAWQRIETIVAAEAVLRACYAYRQEGARLGDPPRQATPLVSGDRLVALES